VSSPADEPRITDAVSVIAGEIEANYPCTYQTPACLPPPVGVSAKILLIRSGTRSVAAQVISPGGTIPTSFSMRVAPGWYEISISVVSGRYSAICPSGTTLVASPGQSIYLQISCVIR
jgi:hypothetical protein